MKKKEQKKKQEEKFFFLFHFNFCVAWEILLFFFFGKRIWYGSSLKGRQVCVYSMVYVHNEICEENHVKTIILY